MDSRLAFTLGITFLLLTSCIPKKKVAKDNQPEEKKSASAQVRKNYKNEIQTIKREIQKDSNTELSESELNDLKEESILTESEYRELAKLTK